VEYWGRIDSDGEKIIDSKKNGIVYVMYFYSSITGDLNQILFFFHTLQHLMNSFPPLKQAARAFLTGSMRPRYT
jgi:hypothetical protein